MFTGFLGVVQINLIISLLLVGFASACKPASNAESDDQSLQGMKMTLSGPVNTFLLSSPVLNQSGKNRRETGDHCCYYAETKWNPLSRQKPSAVDVFKTAKVLNPGGRSIHDSEIRRKLTQNAIVDGAMLAFSANMAKATCMTAETGAGLAMCILGAMTIISTEVSLNKAISGGFALDKDKSALNKTIVKNSKAIEAIKAIVEMMPNDSINQGTDAQCLSAHSLMQIVEKHLK
ncbi:hypothetical protein EBR21_05430 [bacterium]|nr:hypothetical protein [bacterium]